MDVDGGALHNGPPLIFHSTINDGMLDDGEVAPGSVARTSESAAVLATTEAMDLDSGKKRIHIPTMEARKNHRAQVRGTNIILAEQKAEGRFIACENILNARKADALERGRHADFANEEILDAIPPRERLQFGPHTIDQTYRDAMFDEFPDYTAEEVVGSFLGKNPHFPSQDDSEVDQIRARAREDEELPVTFLGRVVPVV